MAETWCGSGRCAVSSALLIAARLRGVFGCRKGAALVVLGDRIGRLANFGLQYRFGVGLGIILRLVAEVIGV